MNSKAKGELTQAVLIPRLMSLGIAVAMPFGDNERYDFILDIKAS